MNSQKKLTKLLYGYYVTQCISMAAKFNIASMIPDGTSVHVSKIAEQTGLNADALYRVLRLLANNEIFIETEYQEFSNSEISLLLDKNRTSSFNSFCQLPSLPIFWNSVGSLESVLKNGKSGACNFFDKELFQYLEENENDSEVFNNAMKDLARADSDYIFNIYDFSQYNSIVDIGGGTGALLKQIQKKYPKTKFELFDQSEVLDQADTKDIKKTPGDFFERVESKADLYILRHILHDWNDSEVLKILSNIKDSMPSNSKILVIELLVDKDSMFNIANYRDFTMLSITSGRERSFEEFSGLAAKVGLQSRVVGKLPNDMHLLEMNL